MHSYFRHESDVNKIIISAAFKDLPGLKCSRYKSANTVNIFYEFQPFIRKLW